MKRPPLKPIARVRFDAIAGYARTSMAHMAEELGYYELEDGRILGILVRDRYDRDYASVVFAPDARRRYRATALTPFGTKRRAQADLRNAMETALRAPPEEHFQGDEEGEPIDFFTLKRPTKPVHPDFKALADEHGFLPARRIIEPMMRWYDDADGNFIEQFQTTGFDQRVWELYLFAAFTEIGYVLDRRHPIPDYMLEGPYGDIAVEAVTVAPSQGGALGTPPSRNTPEGRRNLLRQYMPIKFGSALFSKLKKRYWEQPKVAGKALVFAIEDFSSPDSMIYTRSSLLFYLYGYAWDHHRDEAGKLVVTPVRLTEHRWNDKVIPSAFFDQPDAEHVSAVLFSNSGTIAKFNRMGVLAGFCPDDVVLVRRGMLPDPRSNASHPIPFQAIVNDPEYEEFWSEGLEVFHNPRAAIPMHPGALPGARHHFFRPNGRLATDDPHLVPLSSDTFIFTPMTVEELRAMMSEASEGAAAD